MPKYKVLVTKKLDPLFDPQAKETDIEIVERSFISTKPILTKEKWDEVFKTINRGIEHVIFTSANAVDALKKYLHPYVNFEPTDWKIFCLDGKTKQSVEQVEALSGKVIASAEDASSLAKIIVESGLTEAVFFCGDKRRNELPDILQQANISLQEVIIYTTEETPVAIDQEFDGVAFFSPSAVNSFFSCNQLNKDAVCFAIGKTTAQTLRERTNNKIITSTSADQQLMMQTIEQYFSK